jgi:hypothetical protein
MGLSMNLLFCPTRCEGQWQRSNHSIWVRNMWRRTHSPAPDCFCNESLGIKSRYTWREEQGTRTDRLRYRGWKNPDRLPISTFTKHEEIIYCLFKCTFSAIFNDPRRMTHLIVENVLHVIDRKVIPHWSNHRFNFILRAQRAIFQDSFQERGCPVILQHRDPLSMNLFVVGMMCLSSGGLCYCFDMKLVHQMFGMENWHLSRKKETVVVYVY